jgi:ATP-binding cassette subfamily C protein LapB
MIPETTAQYFSQLTLFSILIGGGYLMIQGGISFGEITACALLGGRAVSPVISLMGQYLQQKDVRLIKNRLDEIAYRQDQYGKDVPEFPEDIDGNIEIINVVYKNMMNKKLESINCKLNSGSFNYIVPAEFMPYRRIFHKIIGKEKVEGGKILIDNLDINEWNMNSMKGKIEYLSDNVSIFKGSIMDNITYFNPSKSQYTYEAAALTGLDEMVAEMTEGFETMLDSQSVNYLSSAFLQRLNLTRVLLIRPRILIIDRIDECMDYDTLKVFLWLLKKVKGKMTILIASDNSSIKSMAEKLSYVVTSIPEGT